MVRSGLSSEDACRILHKSAPSVSPNRWVAFIAGDILGIGNALVGAIEETFTLRRDGHGYAVGEELAPTVVWE